MNRFHDFDGLILWSKFTWASSTVYLKLKFINSQKIKFVNLRKKIFLKLSSNQKSFHNNKGRREQSQLVFKIEEKILFHKLNFNESVIFLSAWSEDSRSDRKKVFFYEKKSIGKNYANSHKRERERVSEWEIERESE